MPFAMQVSFVAQQELTLAFASQGTIRGPLTPSTAALPSGYTQSFGKDILENR